jgi:FkbM family methyltransferase
MMGWKHGRKLLAAAWKQLDPAWLIDCGPGPLLPGEARRAKNRWPDIQVLGIEPSPAHSQIQFESGYPGRLISCAVSDKDGDLIDFYPSTKWMSMYPSKEKRFRTAPITVPTVTIDSLDQRYGPFSDVIIWADIQGAELSMLEGASNLLQSGRVIAINLEVMPVPFDGWPSEQEVREFLADKGFHPVVDAISKRHQHYDMLFLPEEMA